MPSRFVLINCPGLGVGDVRNSSSSNHSIEKLLKYAYESQLNCDLSGLETIGFEAFVKYQGNVARRSSVTARLASRKIHGLNDFEALNEAGGGDEAHLPVFATFSGSESENTQDDIFPISIGSDESIIPSFEHFFVESDSGTRENLIEVCSAPLVRNEFVLATFSDFREAALEANPTFAAACLVHLSKTISDLLPLLGANDGLMVLSTTAIDVTAAKPEFRNELTPMMYHTPMGQIADLGLRLLSDVGPSIAEFFGLDRRSLIGASMGKWMAAIQDSTNKQEENPQEQSQSQLHS